MRSYLHGLDHYPESLVLTEDDHLEFLVAISQELGRPVDRIPARVREALTRSSLLLLGYDLQSWEFRTLFWGLLKPREIRQQGVSVLHLQLELGEKEQQQYLRTYLSKADLEVFMGSIHEYTSELFRTLFASP
jgi:SIR2-like protein